MPGERTEQLVRRRLTPVCPPNWVRDFMGKPSKRSSKATSELSPRLPTEIFQSIVDILHTEGAKATLASLLCVKHLRELAAPKLYGTIHVTARTISKLLVGLPRATADERRSLVQRPVISLDSVAQLWPNCPCPSDDDSEVHDPPGAADGIRGSIAQRVQARANRCSKRKLLLFSLTRKLVIDDVPATRHCADLLHACHALRPALLLPEVFGLQLCFGVVDTLSYWRERNGGMRHPLVRALEAMMRPFAMCIDCRLSITEADFLADYTRLSSLTPSHLAHLEGTDEVYDTVLEKYDAWYDGRPEHMSDDLPRWDSLYSVSFHHVEHAVIGHYPVPRVNVFFPDPEYWRPDVVRMIARMLGEPQPFRPKGGWMKDYELPGFVSLLSAYFPVREGTRGLGSPDMTWNEDLSLLVGDEMTVSQPDDDDEVDDSVEAVYMDVRWRLAGLRTEEGNACLCCGLR